MSFNNNTSGFKPKRLTAKKTCSQSLILFVSVLVMCAIMMIYMLNSNDVSQEINALKGYLKPTQSIDIHAVENLALKSTSKTNAFRQRNNTVYSTSSTLPSVKVGKARIAFAITITKDGFFQDGAAVLAYSIMKHIKSSLYDISFIAFVHPNVTSSRVGLRRLGFHVLEVPTPVNTSAIKFDFLREKINKNGCCGAAELIKLTSYRLTQYDRVVHLDADTLMTGSLEELFSRDFSLVYTTDPNMASYKGEDKMPVQGGFLVVRPSAVDYRLLVDTLMTTEFAKGSGWNRSRIGWCWGGMTVQGLLPYYYNRVTAPNRTQVLDRCVYNSMADTPDCILRSIDQVKSAHFTVCQKPWGCWKQYDNALCGSLHRRWFELRKEAEAFYSLPVVENACPKGGPRNYVPMALDAAIFPLNSTLNVLPDDSAARWDPIPEGRYTSSEFN